MEHCLVYFSTWNPSVPLDELSRLLEQSRQANRQVGVTGVTLYVRGQVIQVLEGSKPVVEALYAKIQQDFRHTGLQKVLDRPIPQRLFGDYRMGYETLTEAQLEEVRALVDLEAPLTGDAQASIPIILKTIKAFYQSNHYN